MFYRYQRSSSYLRARRDGYDWMGKELAGIDEEQLRQQLRTETDPKAVKRLTAALLYADGSSPYKIEHLLGFPA
jgi:hypothetical protein